MLTTKEFIEKVEELGHRVEENQAVISIFKNNLYAAMTRKDTQFKFNTLYGVTEDEKLFNLLVEYAQTPIDKREKKGYLWVKNLERIFLEGNQFGVIWLNQDSGILEPKKVVEDIEVDYLKYTESEKEDIERKTGVPLVFLEEVVG